MKEGNAADITVKRFPGKKRAHRDAPFLLN